MTEAAVPDQLVEQRLRNRIMEYWRWIADEKLALEYDVAVSPIGVSVYKEIFNQFDNYVFEGYPINSEHYPDPVYTDNEREILSVYSELLNQICHATPDNMSLPAFIQTPEWKKLNQTARQALAIFEQRGYLSEEELISHPCRDLNLGHDSDQADCA